MVQEDSNNYISLKEAMKYCHYSQEYLSLRARQGKLKAVRFGRNWVTKKEWLAEYLKKVEEYNNYLNNKKETRAVSEKKFISPPKNLPVEGISLKSPTLRFGFSLAMVFVLLITGIAFGQESFKNVLADISPLVQEFSENFNRDMVTVGQAMSAISGSKNQLADVGGLLKEYGQWFASGVEEIGRQTQEGAKSFVQAIKEISRLVTKPFKEKLVKEEVPFEISEKEIEELRTEIKKLKEEGIPAKEIIKEITRITQVEPIKEITKEVIKIDDKELAKIKKELSSFALWGTDIENLRAITQKIQAYPAQTPVPTAPIYIGSQGIQVGGVGTFASLGVSGSAGIGTLGVGGSTSLGSTSSDKLTVQATSEFNAPVFAKAGLTVGTGTLNIDKKGNLTTTGKITAKSDLIVDGTLQFAGTTRITNAGVATFTGLTSSGTITFSGLTADRLVTTTTGGALATSIFSANLALSVTDETGAGLLVFGTSPSFTTSVVTGSASFDVFNTTATTINAFGAATALTIGATTGTTTIRTPTLALSADSAILNFSSATGTKQIQTGGITHLALMPGGNVGIGTIAPATRLQVEGTVRMTGFQLGTTATAGHVLTTDASGVGTWQAAAGGVGVTWPLLSTIDGTVSAPAYSWGADTNMGIRRGGISDLRFVTAGADRLTINSVGNVGIGTAAPGTLLTLRRSTTGNVFAIRNIGDTADTFTITDAGIVNLGTWQGTAIGAIHGGTSQTAVATGDILFGSAANAWSRLAVGASGTVLVGGTIPSWSASPSLTSLTLTGATPLTLSGASPVTIARDTATADILAIDNLGIGTLSLNLVDGGLRTAGTERLTNVGALTNITGITSSGTITFSGLTADRLVTTTTGGALATSIFSANLALSVTDETGAGLLVFGTSPSFTTSVVTGSASFDVFNTTATTVNFAGAATALTIGATSGTTTIRNTNLALSADSAVLNFSSSIGTKQIQTGGTTHLALMPGGNVGIGITTPATRLHVEGTVRMTGFQLGTTATAGHVLTTDASGVGTWQAAAGGVGVTWPLLSTIDGTVSAPAYSWGADTNMGIRRGGIGDLRFVTAGADRLTIDSVGNLGIGTTTPATRLHVVGTTRGVGGAQILSLSTPGVPTVTPQGTTGTTTWGYRITARSSVGETLASTEGRTTTGNAILGATNFNRITWSAVAGAIDYRVYRTTAGGTPSTTGLIGTTTSLTFDDTGLAASGAVPTIDSSGNVGIGTTVPGRRLEVLQANSVPQLRLSQSATVFSELFIDSAGDLRVSATGQDIRALDENLWVCAGGACPSISIRGTGNLVIEGDVYAAGYRRASCPTGMIEVPPSPQDGMDGFCVDKYEAKNVGGIATSQADLTPWVSIAQFNARAECIRAGKHLITEKEWQAIAHNIERVGWNWNGGVVGTNQMSDGHSDNAPAGSLVADVIGDPNDDPCVGTGQVCSPTVWDSQRRTYRLSNGQHIWDFGGNVWEWVDQVNEDEYPVHNSPVIGWVACSTTGDGICGNTLTTNDQWFRGGTLATRGFLRGSAWDSGANSGAFALALHYAPAATSTLIGFRCAR